MIIANTQDPAIGTHASVTDEAIILVGGRGTRLRAVVSDVPKPLAPVAGRPFLAWLLDSLGSRGIGRVILATGHMSEKIRAFVGDDWHGISIDYSHEEVPLGTGGALRKAATLLKGDSVHVLNGDTFLDYSPAGLAQATRAANAAIGIALAAVDDVARYGAVEMLHGKVAAFHEKGASGPGLINAGSYFLDASALVLLKAAPTVFSFESELLVPLARQGCVAGFAETSAFIDIGVPEDYQRAQAVFGQPA